MYKVDSVNLSAAKPGHLLHSIQRKVSIVVILMFFVFFLKKNLNTHV